MQRRVSRREQDTGTVGYEQRTGRWYARLPRRLGRRSLGSHPTEQAAHEALADELERIAAEGAPDDLTLEVYGRDYLDRREATGHYRPDSVAKDRDRWRCYVEGSRLGRMLLPDVRERDVRRWLGGLRRQDGAPLGGQTQANALAVLRWVLEDARTFGHVRENVAAPVRLPKGARAKGDAPWTWLTLAEIRALLGDRKLSPHQRSIIVVGIYAGLRAGELCGLRWQDVDLRRGVLTVWRSRGGPTKGGYGREVQLLDPAAEALEAWRDHPKRPRSHLDLVWPARDGSYHREGYDAGLRAALERVGVTRRVRFHDLRDTCASHLLQGSWVPHYTDRPLRLEEVRDWLGHTDVGVTQRYAHLAADGLRARVVRTGQRAVRNAHRYPKAPVAQRIEQRFPKALRRPPLPAGSATLLTGFGPEGWSGEQVTPGPAAASLAMLDGLAALELEHG